MSEALSFHCMICFDQFDPEKKYPVVLPCGHTYICLECASRIEKCMECRAPLFAPERKSGHETNNNHPNSNQHIITSRWDIYEQRRRARAFALESSRRSPRAIVDQKKIKMNKTRLPLPKNVVLLSLIEASNLANQTTRLCSISSDRGTSIVSSLDSSIVPHSSSLDYGDEEEIEQNKILMSMDLATSSCGTYAVMKKSGLTIVPNIDKASSRRVFAGKKSLENTLMKKKSYGDAKNQQPKEMHLNYGDRVQVVTIVNNWAKLARGYGYVHIENINDLIKVGGVLDRACNIESMLYILSFRRSHLIDHKECIERDSIKLMQELQDTLIENEDLTVIGAEAFRDKDNIISQNDTRDDDSFWTNSKDRGENSLSNSNNGDKSNSASENNAAMSSTASPPPRRSLVTPTPTWCTNDTAQSDDLISWFGGFFSYSNSLEIREPSDSLFTKEDEQNYQNLLASAESWRKRNGRQAERGGIDFRTGRSGHLGAHGHHASNHSHHGVTSFKISAHSGLTPSRPHRKHIPTNLPSNRKTRRNSLT